MKRIVIHGGTYCIERPGAAWAKVVAGVLLAPWILAMLYAFATETGNGGAIALTWTLFAFVPAAIIKWRWGSMRRDPITAVIEARDVPGGSFVAVVDARGARHELVVDPNVARGLAYALTVGTEVEHP